MTQTTIETPRAELPSLAVHAGAAGAFSAVGSLLAAEAILSPFVDSHLAYHGLNTVLNVALVVACLRVATMLPRRGGRIAARMTLVFAALAAIGGAWVFLAKAAGSDVPGVADGVAHTAVLFSFLTMAFLGLGIRRIARGPGIAMAIAAFAPVVMVLGFDLDSPSLFLVPELLIGCAWIALAGRVRARA